MKFFNSYRIWRESKPDSEIQQRYSEDLICKEFDKAKRAQDIDMEEYQTESAAQRRLSKRKRCKNTLNQLLTICFKARRWAHNIDGKFEFSDDSLKLNQKVFLLAMVKVIKKGRNLLCIYLRFSNKKCEPQVELVHSLDVTHFETRSDLRGKSVVGPYDIP